MASIKNISTGKSYTLTPSFIIGRDSVCTLRIMSRLVSLEHAVLSWGNSGWQLRDLNSKNGTFVDQRRLVPGEQVRVTTGSEMAFGDLAEQFVMTDDAAPVAFARTSDGKRRDADSDGIL